MQDGGAPSQSPYKMQDGGTLPFSLFVGRGVAGEVNRIVEVAQ